MKRRSFTFFQSIYFKIPLLFIFILLIAFQFIGVYFIEQLETQSVATFRTQINRQADFLINNVSPIMADEDIPDQELKQRLGQVIDTFRTTADVATEIRIIDADNTMLATNQTIEQPFVGTKNEDPWIEASLSSRSSISDQIVAPASNTPYYVLIQPIFGNNPDEFYGVVYIEAEMSSVNSQVQGITQVFLQSALLAMGIALVLSLVLSQGLTRPIENMRQQAIRISEGVYNYLAEVYGQDELGELTVTINDLANKVKDARESTESERQRLDGVLRHMTDGVIGTDRRGSILFINDRASELLDIHPDQATGASIINLLDLEGQYEISDLMMTDKEIMLESEGDHFNTMIKAEFSVIRRETGFVTGLVCVLTDITEQERTNQERRDFVSNVSHELRTPLTSVKSYSEALIDGAWQDKTLAPQFLKVIQSESNRMIRMISNLLDLSKMDGGQIVLRKEYIDLRRFINHILDRFEFTLESNPEDKKYQLVRSITHRNIYVEVDQDRLTQVLDNLLNNAAKYSPDGGQITVTVAEGQDSVIVSVADQGLGIAPKDLPQLFDRFYRVDKARSRDQGGSGLGLAISKEVIELHGGHIWVESVEGKGSTFSFELPFTEFEAVDEDWG